MTTTEAIELREKLEREILYLLAGFQCDTGLVPSALELRTVEASKADGSRVRTVAGVRVTVEV
jgi:hypothetical protein